MPLMGAVRLFVLLSSCNVEAMGKAWSSAEIIKLLKAEGWVLDRTKGSHHIFKHPLRAGIVVVPHPKKDLPAGTVGSIAKQAGLKLT